MAKETSEERLNRTFRVGQSSGLEEAAKMLMAKALDYFRCGEDRTASLLRTLSEKLLEEAARRHPAYKKSVELEE